MPRTRYALLNLLSDGRFHSGQHLGECLGISRTAVWKQIQNLADMGIRVDAVQGKGYRLPEGVELLDESAIRDALGDPHPALRLQLFNDIDSTSSHLMTLARQGEAGGLAVLAESQRAGRGRHGRRWVSTFGRNIYLSMLWRFDSGIAAIGGLSLAVGVAMMRALNDCGIDGARLKWPNDLLWQRRKLGGVLVEVAGESVGPCLVVIGIGINMYLPEASGQEIDQPWADLRSLPGGDRVSRNQLAGRMLYHLAEMLNDFPENGLAAYVDEWNKVDAYAGERVCLVSGHQRQCGIARGIDATGALLLEHHGALGAYTGGELSLRAETDDAAD